MIRLMLYTVSIWILLYALMFGACNQGSKPKISNYAADNKVLAAYGPPICQNAMGHLLPCVGELSTKYGGTGLDLTLGYPDGLPLVTTTGNLLSIQNWVTETTTQSVLGGAFSITLNGTYQDTGLSVSLTTGKWKITGEVRTQLGCSVGNGYITIKLRNTTDSVDVTSSERAGAICSTLSTTYWATVPVEAFVSISSGTKNYNIFAITPAGVTYSQRIIASDADGRSVLRAMKINPIP